MENIGEELSNFADQNKRIQELSLQLALEKRENSELKKQVAKHEETNVKLQNEIRMLYKESGRFEEKIEVNQL